MRKKKSIQFNIVVSFSILLLIGFVSIMWYVYSNNSTYIIDFSKRLISETKNKAKNRIVTFLEDAEKTSILMSKLVDESSDISINNTPLINYMVELVKLYPQVTPIYVGDERGNFLAIRTVSPGDTYRSSRKLLPNAVKFSIRVVSTTPGNSFELWRYLAGNGSIIDEEKLSRITYDPRTRPWYLGAKQKRDVFWTDIYIFQASRKPGITVAFPLYSRDKKFFGALGSDINMSKISELIRKDKFSSMSTTFIATKEGELVSHPDPKNSIKISGDSIKVALMNELDDPKIRVAYQRFLWEKNNQFTYNIDGEEYIADFAQLPKSFEKDWIIGVVVPVDYFIGNIKKTQKEAIILSLFAFILSVFLVWLLAQRISVPISLLTEETDKLRKLELDNNVNINSSILEIDMMDRSIQMMQRSLKSFSKYVPKTLVKKLMVKGIDVKIGGKPRELTILFSDIQGFTSVSENYPPELLMTHLSEYFEELTTIIGEQQGTVDKYIGDAIMAFWGAPAIDKKHALNACRAALMCQLRLSELNRKWDSQKKPRLYTRIGLHTDEVIVGNLGSSDRMNYTIIGDGVNLASRLEGLNKYYDTKILISETTYDLVDKYCLVRPIDKVKVKGKSNPVLVYELIALKKAMESGDARLMPSRDQLQMAQIFSRAYNAYTEKRWSDAEKDFALYMEKFGEDLPCRIYIDRCKEFKRNPPPKDWDGSYQIATK